MNKREEFEKTDKRPLSIARMFEAMAGCIRAGDSLESVCRQYEVTVHSKFGDIGPAQPSQDGLPELPEPQVSFTIGGYVEPKVTTGRFAFTDAQMLAYGAQCRAAALEQAAQIVEHKAFPSEAARFGKAADAIRALAAAQGK